MNLEKIENSIFLRQVYGLNIVTDHVKIIMFSIERMEYVKLSLSPRQRAMHLPRKWQEYDGLYFDIIYSGISSLYLNFDNTENGFSEMAMQFGDSGKNSISIAGQLEIKFEFEFARSQNFQPSLLE